MIYYQFLEAPIMISFSRNLFQDLIKDILIRISFLSNFANRFLLERSCSEVLSLKQRSLFENALCYLGKSCALEYFLKSMANTGGPSYESSISLSSRLGLSSLVNCTNYDSFLSEKVYMRALLSLPFTTIGYF